MDEDHVLFHHYHSSIDFNLIVNYNCHISKFGWINGDGCIWLYIRQPNTSLLLAVLLLSVKINLLLKAHLLSLLSVPSLVHHAPEDLDSAELNEFH